MKKKIDVPLNQKFCLTVYEASAYTGIPVGIIRKMTHSPSCTFTFGKPKQGKRVLILREMLEEYIKNSKDCEEVE